LPTNPEIDSGSNRPQHSKGIAEECHPAELRYGRYTLVNTEPTTEQRDLLAQIIEVNIPSSLNPSVQDALHYVLQRSGYALCPVTASVKVLFTRPLPAAHYRLGPSLCAARYKCWLAPPGNSRPMKSAVRSASNSRKLMSAACGSHQLVPSGGGTSMKASTFQTSLLACFAWRSPAWSGGLYNQYQRVAELQSTNTQHLQTLDTLQRDSSALETRRRAAVRAKT
jgi:conjugative transfer region protein (TIGR03748 family)